MPIRYKINVLAALSDAGYTSYKLSKEHLLANSTIQKLRQGLPVSWDNLTTICRLLKCQPGDLIEYVEEKPQ